MILTSAAEPRPLIGIAALASNRVIGADGKLPWRLPEDFKRFKATTMGGVLIMGRVSYAEIGRPLPGRDIVVLSRTVESIPGVTVIRDPKDVRDLFPGKPLFLAGGATVYRDHLALCDELILTHVKSAYAGDAFFPDWKPLFDDGEIIAETPDFTIRRHRRAV